MKKGIVWEQEETVTQRKEKKINEDVLCEWILVRKIFCFTLSPNIYT